MLERLIVIYRYSVKSASTINDARRRILRLTKTAYRCDEDDIDEHRHDRLVQDRASPQRVESGKPDEEAVRSAVQAENELLRATA